MRGYGWMKDDYLKRSRERIHELESEIEFLSESVPSIESRMPARKLSELVSGLNEGAKELEINVAEMGVSNSESWEWTLEIEDTEWLFKVLKKRIDQVKRVLEENNMKNSLGATGEKSKTKMKG